MQQVFACGTIYQEGVCYRTGKECFAARELAAIERQLALRSGIVAEFSAMTTDEHYILDLQIAATKLNLEWVREENELMRGLYYKSVDWLHALEAQLEQLERQRPADQE